MSNLYDALARLLDWAEHANSRLPYEQDKGAGMQFGGNPYLNPIVRQARQALLDNQHLAPDDRETIAPGDERYYSVEKSGAQHSGLGESEKKSD